jgi:hypothetical protein
MARLDGSPRDAHGGPRRRRRGSLAGETVGTAGRAGAGEEDQRPAHPAIHARQVAAGGRKERIR